MDHPNEYRGYSIHWTGWKSLPNQSLKVGQWLANPESSLGPKLYVSVPGGVRGEFQTGYVFDISMREDWDWLEPWTPGHLWERAKARGLEILKEYIDEHCKEADHADL